MCFILTQLSSIFLFPTVAGQFSNQIVSICKTNKNYLKIIQNGSFNTIVEMKIVRNENVGNSHMNIFHLYFLFQILFQDIIIAKRTITLEANSKLDCN